MNPGGYDKSAVRFNFDCGAIRIRGETIHPECRTDEEVMMTAIFINSAKVPDSDCPRCGNTLLKAPAR